MQAREPEPNVVSMISNEANRLLVFVKKLKQRINFYNVSVQFPARRCFFPTLLLCSRNLGLFKPDMVVKHTE